MYNETGIVIQIIVAASESSTTIEFNATSVLTTTTSVLDIRNVNSIQCGNVAVSRSIDIMVNVQGKSCHHSMTNEQFF